MRPEIRFSLLFCFSFCPVYGHSGIFCDNLATLFIVCIVVLVLIINLLRRMLHRYGSFCIFFLMAGFWILPSGFYLSAQPAGVFSDTSRAGVKWFPDAKLGIFIHWTLANVPELPEEGQMDFKERARSKALRFKADRYDAREWAKQFKQWGATYAVLTAKHHIGFSLFKAPGGQFNVVDHSPVGRDLIGEYVEALRAEGLKVGLYYSLPDWSHPDYATLADSQGKMKGPLSERDKRAYAEQSDTVRWNKFIEQMFREVRHLCTAYGKIDLLWFDGDWERSGQEWNSLRLAAMIDSLQPDIVLNNRLRHKDLGHYATPEQVVPLAPRPGWWELCFTPGDNWDGGDANNNLKQPQELIRIFGDVLSMGGNMLINVAPIDDGAIPAVQRQVLDGLGNWAQTNREGIFGSRMALPWGLFNGGATRKGRTLYLISYDQPRELVLKGTENEPLEIIHIATGTPLKWRYSGGFKGWNKKGWLYIQWPENLPHGGAEMLRIRFQEEMVQFNTPQGEVLNFR